ncbi:(d)CMP kinase [Sedimentibacter sp. MB31-C6]|uniref:(d)CMP kinase n=1 Tax=Sedimentibacter sp. MB31-C6 TaxID=3109366 RepID=UPI002DDD4BF0|nr:(d)CMP kinase [Sedimentibacter sp. MB36-C1]WSI04211.1 (d)CMP kinase [Sedimentibacter sp. MB36-C1]
MKGTSRIMIIAIDGPSGAGKSTVAKLVSKKLGFEYIDTGAMYRALAYKACKNNVEINEKNSEKLVNNTNIDYFNNSIYLDGDNVDNYIRDENISKAASKISALENVRIKMVTLQRNIAKNKSVILDGRDIGTHVFPNANYKFFITASVEERAKRRYNQLKSENFNVDYDNILADIFKRDENDTNREISPLRIADDAIIIDTTDMKIEDVVNYIINFIGGNTCYIK